MSAQFRNIILSPLFLICLFLLLLNDFYLKAEFHNFFTGKLSDFAGLFIFPLFISAFFTQRKTWIFVSTVIFFVFWKSAYSQVFIDSWNRLSFFQVDRIVDYTDLLAVSVLPFSYFYLKLLSTKTELFPKRILASFVIFLSVFAFTATSFREERGFYYGKKYDVNLTRKEFEEKLSTFGNVRDVDVGDRDFNLHGNSNSNFNPNSDHLSYFFDLREEFCDSRKIKVFVVLERTGGKNYSLELGKLGFWCKRDPTEQDKKEILAIFEREIIEKL